jgi:hypothetical protein
VSASGWNIWYSQHPGGRHHLVSIRVPHADISSRPNYVRKLTEYQVQPSAAGNSVEINRVRIEVLNWLSYQSDCLKSKERERQANIYGKEEGILGEAEYHIWRPMPSITAGASPTPRHGGWWRPMRAATHRPHARGLRPSPHKPSGQIPCQ